MVKEPLFSAYPTPAALARAEIHRCGAHHPQPRILPRKGTAHHRGREDPDVRFWRGGAGYHGRLLSIPGVGRKTANIVLYHGFGKNHGIAVDTHVRRLAQRIGFSDTDDVTVIEHDLMALFPKKEWGDLTDVFIAHGRACCTAKKPQCPSCMIRTLCRYYRTNPEN